MVMATSDVRKWVPTRHGKPGREIATDNLVVVSCDTHIGPLLSDLRRYCPRRYLEDFDDFSKAFEAHDESRWHLTEYSFPTAESDEDATENQYNGQFMQGNEVWAQMARHQQALGHHDMHARIGDLDAEGIAAEVIFHGSQNGMPIPFVTGHVLEAGFTFPWTYVGIDPERTAVGLHIYNEWLADVCTIEPERHAGLAAIPAWDPDLCVSEVEWAAEHGLRGVSLPAIRPGMPLYDDPRWERFWGAVADCELTLANHVAAADEPGNMSVIEHGYHSTRLIWRLTLSGVFERHPKVKLVIAEAVGAWWQYVMYAMDSMREGVGGALPKLPSQYAATNVFHGATFISPEEVETAVEADYWRNILWGSDYPHYEGTWQAPAVAEEEPQTHLHLRDSFAGLAEDKVRAMVGLNACDVFGFDVDALRRVANRITAPTMAEVQEPLLEQDVPSPHGYLTFRRNPSKFGDWQHWARA